MDEETEKIEEFFGVYLLICQNPKYSGRTYVGFTVDPERRLKQHNGGRDAGGAMRTSNKGPWAMVLIVHGFPNMISALRFEWAWQHPQRSRRLNSVPGKKKSENLFAFHIRLLGEMLLSGPWCRLPLTVRWLRPELKGSVDFSPDRSPPMHMPIVYGQVKSVSLKKKKSKGGQAAQENNDEELLCGLCMKNVDKLHQAQCLSTKCSSVYHIVCLADQFRKSGSEKNSEFFLPVEGQCPICDRYTLWGDIIRKMKGCYEDLAEEDKN